MLALVTVHLILVFYHKHTQWPGPGRTERNVVGNAVLARLHGQGRRVLPHGLRRHRADRRPAPSTRLDVRALRPRPGVHGFPARLVPGLRGGPAADHAPLGDPRVGPHVRPGTCCCPPWSCRCPAWSSMPCRSSRRGSPATSASTTCCSARATPTRTASRPLGRVYGILLAAGGNDILATRLHLSQPSPTRPGSRLLLVPSLAFIVTRRRCLALQRPDMERLDTARRRASSSAPPGGYRERHAPVRADRAARAPPARAAARPPDASRTPTATRSRPRTSRSDRLRARLSQLMYADEQPLPEEDETTKSLPES